MMDKNAFENPMNEEKGRTRFLKLALLVAAFIATCILFFTAFNLFQPDQKSLSDIYFPSATATLTRTPTSTPTLTPTPTPNLTATQQAIWFTATAQAIQTTISNAGTQWQVVFLEDFSTNKKEWPTGIRNTDYANTSREFDGGQYLWTITSKRGFVAWVEPTVNRSYSDFHATIECTLFGSDTAECGLIFRMDPSDNYYYFDVDNSGRFSFYLRYKDEWEKIIGQTSNSQIKIGKPNRITVIAEGSHFIFLVNDKFVAEAVDDRVGVGSIMMAYSLDDNEQATFKFDNFEIRIP
jgi:hypothetical protein